MFRKYFVDNQGKRILEGEYFEEEIINRDKKNNIPQLCQNHACSAEEIENMVSLTSSNKSPASNAKSRKRWVGLPKEILISLEIFISLCQWWGCKHLLKSYKLL